MAVVLLVVLVPGLGCGLGGSRCHLTHWHQAGVERADRLLELLPPYALLQRECETGEAGVSFTLVALAEAEEAVILIVSVHQR